MRGRVVRTTTLDLPPRLAEIFAGIGIAVSLAVAWFTLGFLIEAAARGVEWVCGLGGGG